MMGVYTTGEVLKACMEHHKSAVRHVADISSDFIIDDSEYFSMLYGISTFDCYKFIELLAESVIGQ